MSSYVIRLECKSVKQLKRTCAELDALGVESFGLSIESESVGVDRGVSFMVRGNWYTCGRQAAPEGLDKKYYTRREFIKAVAHVLGESK